MVVLVLVLVLLLMLRVPVVLLVVLLVLDSNLNTYHPWTEVRHLIQTEGTTTHPGEPLGCFFVAGGGGDLCCRHHSE